MIPTGSVDDGVVTKETLAQARAWLVRLRSGDATQEEFEAFRRWCAERPEYAASVKLVKQTWSRLDAAVAEYVVQRPAEHPSIALRRLREARQVQPRRPGRRAFVGFSLAAGASWLALRPPLGLWPSVGDLAADYRTGTGEQRQVALSQRVMVSLNTQTRIDVLPRREGSGIRLLAGQAEIVASADAGRPSAAGQVVVVAGPGRLQAEVAQFDVRRTDRTVCVTCVSGSVSVDHPQRRVTLTAARQVVYDDRAMHAVADADTAVTTAWRRGVLIFRGTPLEEVVAELNRYRPGRIVLQNTAQRDSRVEAEVRVKNLDRAIDLLSSVYGLHVTRLPGRIVLLS